jgi:hypothetical protein
VRIVGSGEAGADAREFARLVPAARTEFAQRGEEWRGGDRACAGFTWRRGGGTVAVDAHARASLRDAPGVASPRVVDGGRRRVVCGGDAPLLMASLMSRLPWILVSRIRRARRRPRSRLPLRW